MAKNLQEALEEALVELDNNAAAGEGNADDPPESAVMTEEGQPEPAQVVPPEGEPQAHENIPPAEPETPETAEPQTPPVPDAPPAAGQTEQQIVGEAALRAAQELGRAKAENDQLKQMLAQMQAAQQQANELNAQKVDASINARPSLDFNALSYMSDEERAAAQTKYTDDLTAYILNSVESRFGERIKPVIESHRSAEREAKETSVLNAMAQLPNMRGFSDKLSQIRDIGNMPEFVDMPPEKKYALAYLVALGRDAANAKPKNAQQLCEEAEKNPDVMKMLEAKRVKAIDGGENLPRFAASSGAASAPVYAEKTPKNLNEAREQSFRLLDLLTKKKEK